MLVLRFLERLIQFLNVPLTITGVLSFFGYSLDIHAVRAALDATFPDHFAVAFSRLTWLDYVWFAAYVVIVWFYWHSERVAERERQLEAAARHSTRKAILQLLLVPLIFVIPLIVMLFSLTLIYLIGDLISPACAVIESEERCADQLGFGGFLLMIGTFAFTLGSTLGASYLGALYRKRSGTPDGTEAE